MLSNAIDRDCKELVHTCVLLCSKGGECLPIIKKATHVVNISSLFSCSGTSIVVGLHVRVDKGRVRFLYSCGRVVFPHD